MTDRPTNGRKGKNNMSQPLPGGDKLLIMNGVSGEMYKIFFIFCIFHVGIHL